MTTVYIVEIGNGLYYINGSFLGNSTTKNIADAKWFLDEKTAAGVAKRTGGQILPYVLERLEERDSEIDMLRSAVIQLQRERDEAYAQISNLLGGEPNGETR